tara:strand:- start:208 stop:480 length:273 start_codon:yes stop_codon:yes gene_type:complete
MTEATTHEKIQKEDVDWLNDTKKSRDIVMEIRKFGVTQNQIKLIIGNLAMELEDRDLMIKIRGCVDPPEEVSGVDNNETKIIHPGGNEDE